MTRFPAVAALVLVAAIALTGCSNAAGSSDSTAEAPAREGLSEALPQGVPEGGVTGAATDADDTRSVISTATLSVTVDDPIAAADDAIVLVERAGGRVDNRSEAPATDDLGRTSSLVVRVPATDLTEFLSAVKELGETEYETITSTDVTAQTTDLESRISALDTSVTRLLDLLSRATDTGDLIELETALSTRQAELESLRAQQRGLADQVALATVSVDFGTDATAPVDRPQDFFSGLVLGSEALAAFFGALLIGAGVVLPWLIVPAMMGTVLVVVLRRRGARRRSAEGPAADPAAARAVPSAAPTTAPPGTGSTTMEG
ncbi:MAG: hypothetical protein RI885_2145 [Actinomycetota bacterium]|jgi:hypothetical protein